MGDYAFGGGSLPRSPAASRSVARRARKSEMLSVARQQVRSTHGRMRRSVDMEIRLTRRPGQAGTRKLLERYGERLVCVRYRYDPDTHRRHKTVELIVDTVPWHPNVRRARRRDEEMVAVCITYAETELRQRAKQLGAIWRPQQRLWEMRWLDAKRLGIADRALRV